MSELFLKILEMSLSASCLVLVLLLLRLVLKKAPKWIHVLLWGLVALRLVMPFSIESNLSLIPEPVSQGKIITNVGNAPIGKTEIIEIFEGSAPSVEQEQPVGSVIVQEGSLQPAKTVANTVYPVLSWIWAAGVVLMLMYTLISYGMLRHRINTAVPLKKGIFQSENVDSPFVLGLIRPKIYLPFRMDADTLEYVIDHEQSHIRRKDHWWKPLGFVLLAFHWFNPLMWLGYFLLCRDIELACDEKVIKQMDNENRANYTQALVTCSVHRRRIAACPLAFGEVGVKERVKSVMNYKKSAFWIVIAAVVISAVVAICFLTNPTESKEPGILSIRAATYAQDDQTPCIELDYFFAGEDEAHSQFQRGKWIRKMSEQETEYTKNGSIPYDGSLGAYRMMLEFSDPGPSVDFRNSHQEGAVYPLEGIKESFGETVRYKVVYPDDDCIIIYIGTDVPFSFKEPDRLDPSGPIQIRLFRFDYAPVDPALGQDVVETFTPGYRTYYRLRDGSWKTEGRIYQYRHPISGTMPDGTDATFVYLSNLETISFEQALQASGFGDDPNGFFPPEDAILVDWLLTLNEPDTNHSDVSNNDDFSLIDPPVTNWDVMISNALLSLQWDEAKDAPLNVESHIILAQVGDPGRPVEGVSIFNREETVFVCYAKERFQVVNGYQEGCGSLSGKALITFAQDENGQYYTKEIRKVSSKKDLAELKEKFPAAMELLEEKEQEYVWYLKFRCPTTADRFLAQLKAQGVTSPDSLWYTPLVENYACDINGDGKRDFYSGTSAELLHPLSYASYDQAKQRYQSWLDSRDTMSDAENYSALAEIYDIIARGSASEQAELAQLFREICNSDTLVFEDKEVFDLAKNYAQVFTGLANGDRDFGVQELTKKSISETVGQVDFSYLGEVWYSVRMMELGEQWVTGEFTAPYQGELGQYLAVIQFHDADQSAQFLPQLSRGVKYPMYFSYNGMKREMFMKIMLNADHGYDVYIGSDEPFSVEERSSVRRNRLSGTVSVTLSFDPQSSTSRLTVTGKGLSQGKHMVFVATTSGRYVLLPFTAIMTQLGADVQWNSNQIAQIRCNGKTYTLNTQAVSLIEVGTDLNCIIPTPGDKLHAQAMDKELMLDHSTVKTVALMLGIPIIVDVDYQNQTVVIDYAG